MPAIDANRIGREDGFPTSFSGAAACSPSYATFTLGCVSCSECPACHIDLTEVERFEVGFREIYDFAIRRSVQGFSRVVKSAIVVRDPVQHGMARMYELLNDNPQIWVRILRSVTEAKEWFADPRDAPHE